MEATVSRSIRQRVDRSKVLRLLAVLLVALALPSPAEEPRKCKLVRIAEWPVRWQGRLPVIDGEINGNKIGVLLDTGAYASLITKAAAERLGLPTQSTSEWMAGFGGASRVYMTRIQELRIGAAVRTHYRVRVGGERPIAGVDFILGDDFFKDVDLEFDYAKGVVRLFRPLDCKGVALAYWDSGALRLPLEDEDKIVVPITVNGRAARALVDSGASSSMVDLSFAARVGLTPETPGVAASHCASGLGSEGVRSWVAKFDTVTLDEETIRDPRLQIADFMPDLSFGRDRHPEVILGTDFLRAHRMLVSRSQRMVYFSYTGGLVFPATPGLECDDRGRGKGVKEALADYDQQIAKNPGDAKALLNRGLLRLRQGELAGSLADLDAVIRLEPGNAVALSARAGARAGLKDYEGALADSDAAIANGMLTAQMHVTRAWLRRAQGDYARAIEELGEALKLEPGNRAARRGRALYLFQTGRFEAAESDFAKLITGAPSDGFNAIWLYLSRARRGLEGRAALEQAAGTLKDVEWPAPVMLYLLGRLDREALLAAAANAQEPKRKGQECEARFYLAQSLIAAGHANDARPLLEAARDACPRDFIEYDAALVELAKTP
jgi:lipoprotein NlpI/predicted aspartyl protease